MAYKAEIPYGCYWSTPFAKWQGAFSGLNSIEFAAHVARREFASRDGLAEAIDHGVLGLTVPQKHCFYGLPWFAGLVGLSGLAGPTVMQACATGVRTLLAATEEVEAGLSTVSLAVTCDRTSNGPHLYYPNPRGPGGAGASEEWMLDNFNCDPLGRHAMIRTAENVAGKHGISTAEQHEAVLLREAQYREALADDSAFLKRFMSLPFDVPDPVFRKTAATLNGDEGIKFSTAEGLSKLKPATPNGSVTFGAQTHPADGNAAITLAAPERARDLSRDRTIRITLHGFGSARTPLAWMPEAPVPAARKALAAAGRNVCGMDVIKMHNPFVVNDILFSRETGVALDRINNFGCSLVWGHPQAPMGTRGVIEVIEELAARGGGWGLFTGCAAGDTAMAVVLHVGGGG